MSRADGLAIPGLLAGRTLAPDVQAAMDEDRDAGAPSLEGLFGEGSSDEGRAPSPFGDEATGSGPDGRLHAALVRLRRLRSQVGAEGLSSAGTRSLIDEVVTALEALAEVRGDDR